MIKTNNKINRFKLIKLQKKIINKLLSIDFINISNELLTNSQFDGWGWEFLFNATKENHKFGAIGYLFHKFNKHKKFAPFEIYNEELDNIQKEHLEIYNLICYIEKDFENLNIEKTNENFIKFITTKKLVIIYNYIDFKAILKRLGQQPFKNKKNKKEYLKKFF
jgi:hypothetical protein